MGKPVIEMCKHYTTTEYPYFKPRCKKGRWASLKCHSERKDCPYYEPSEEGDAIQESSS